MQCKHIQLNAKRAEVPMAGCSSNELSMLRNRLNTNKFRDTVWTQLCSAISMHACCRSIPQFPQTCRPIKSKYSQIFCSTIHVYCKHIIAVSLTILVSIHLLIHFSTHLCRHPSLLHSFTPGSKPTFSTNPFHRRFLLPILDYLTITGLDRTYLSCSSFYF